MKPLCLRQVIKKTVVIEAKHISSLDDDDQYDEDEEDDDDDDDYDFIIFWDQHVLNIINLGYLN